MYRYSVEVNDDGKIGLMVELEKVLAEHGLDYHFNQPEYADFISKILAVFGYKLHTEYVNTGRFYTPDFAVYGKGICHLSICTTMTDTEEIVKQADIVNPTGLDHGWSWSKENFITGENNPCPCSTRPETHKHYLLVC